MVSDHVHLRLVVHVSDSTIDPFDPHSENDVPIFRILSAEENLLALSVKLDELAWEKRVTVFGYGEDLTLHEVGALSVLREDDTALRLLLVQPPDHEMTRQHLHLRYLDAFDNAVVVFRSKRIGSYLHIALKSARLSPGSRNQ